MTFLEWSKLKAFADDILIVTQAMISLIYLVENIMEKGENAGCQHFPFSKKGFNPLLHRYSF